MVPRAMDDRRPLEVIIPGRAIYNVNNFGNYFGIFLIFDHILGLWVKITCFLSFSSKSHAESFTNFVKNLILKPNRIKLDQSRDLDMSGPAKTSPGGQVLVSKAGFCFIFFRNYTFPFVISKCISFL